MNIKVTEEIAKSIFKEEMRFYFSRITKEGTLSTGDHLLVSEDGKTVYGEIVLSLEGANLSIYKNDATPENLKSGYVFSDMEYDGTNDRGEDWYIPTNCPLDIHSYKQYKSLGKGGDKLVFRIMKPKQSKLWLW